MKRSILTRILKNQSGQGITEYILLLVIIVALVFGGLFQLNSAFEKWANNYFGNYLACLLETGELPSVGGAPGDSGICNELFEPFDLADGRPFKAGAGDGKGGDEDGGDDSSDENSDSRRGGDGNGGGVRETVGSGGGSSSSGSSFGRSGQFGASSRGQNFSSNRKDKAKYTGSTASSIPAGVGYSQTHSKKGRPQYIAITGNRIVDMKDKETADPSTSGTIDRDPGSPKSKTRIQVKRKEISKNNMPDDEPWTFGSFLRFLLIAAIIIALLMFLGGQALQISKDSE